MIARAMEDGKRGRAQTAMADAESASSSSDGPHPHLYYRDGQGGAAVRRSARLARRQAASHRAGAAIGSQRAGGVGEPPGELPSELPSEPSGEGSQAPGGSPPLGSASHREDDAISLAFLREPSSELTPLGSLSPSPPPSAPPSLANTSTPPGYTGYPDSAVPSPIAEHPVLSPPEQAANEAANLSEFPDEAENRGSGEPPRDDTEYDAEGEDGQDGQDGRDEGDEGDEGRPAVGEMPVEPHQPQEGGEMPPGETRRELPDADEQEEAPASAAEVSQLGSVSEERLQMVLLVRPAPRRRSGLWHLQRAVRRLLSRPLIALPFAVIALSTAILFSPLLWLPSAPSPPRPQDASLEYADDGLFRQLAPLLTGALASWAWLDAHARGAHGPADLTESIKDSMSSIGAWAESLGEVWAQQVITCFPAANTTGRTRAWRRGEHRFADPPMVGGHEYRSGLDPYGGWFAFDLNEDSTPLWNPQKLSTREATERARQQEEGRQQPQHQERPAGGLHGRVNLDPDEQHHQAWYPLFDLKNDLRAMGPSMRLETKTIASDLRFLVCGIARLHRYVGASTAYASKLLCNTRDKRGIPVLDSELFGTSPREVRAYWRLLVQSSQKLFDQLGRDGVPSEIRGSILQAIADFIHGTLVRAHRQVHIGMIDWEFGPLVQLQWSLNASLDEASAASQRLERRIAAAAAATLACAVSPVSAATREPGEQLHLAVAAQKFVRDWVPRWEERLLVPGGGAVWSVGGEFDDFHPVDETAGATWSARLKAWGRSVMQKIELLHGDDGDKAEAELHRKPESGQGVEGLGAARLLSPPLERKFVKDAYNIFTWCILCSPSAYADKFESLLWDTVPTPAPDLPGVSSPYPFALSPPYQLPGAGLGHDGYGGHDNETVGPALEGDEAMLEPLLGNIWLTPILRLYRGPQYAWLPRHGSALGGVGGKAGAARSWTAWGLGDKKQPPGPRAEYGLDQLLLAAANMRILSRRLNIVAAWVDDLEAGVAAFWEDVGEMARIVEAIGFMPRYRHDEDWLYT